MIELVQFAAFNFVVLHLLRVGREKPLHYLGIIWLMGVLIAFMLPEDALSNSNGLTTLVQILSYISPAERFARNTAFHDVALVYYSITLLGFPFACRLVSNSIRDNPKRGALHLDREKFRFKHYLASFSTIIFFIAFFLVWWFLYGGEDTRFYQSGSSRLALGIFGMFLQVVAAALITMPFLIIKKLVVGHCWGSPRRADERSVIRRM